MSMWTEAVASSSGTSPRAEFRMDAVASFKPKVCFSDIQDHEKTAVSQDEILAIRGEQNSLRRKTSPAESGWTLRQK